MPFQRGVWKIKRAVFTMRCCEGDEGGENELGKNWCEGKEILAAGW